MVNNFDFRMKFLQGMLNFSESPVQPIVGRAHMVKGKPPNVSIFVKMIP